MHVPETPQAIRRVVMIVQSTMGLCFGLYLFTYGVYYYEHFGAHGDAQTAILLTTTLLAVRQGLIALLDVPTGAYADAVGRDRAVRWSFFFRMLFFIFLAAIAICRTRAMAFTCGLLSCLAFALAASLFSGAFTAWVVDSLRRTAPTASYEAVISRGYEFLLGAQVVGSLLGVGCYLAGVPSLAYLLGASACFACMAYCMTTMDAAAAAGARRKPALAELARRGGEYIVTGFTVCRREPALLALVGFMATFAFLVNLVDFLWPVAMQSRFGTREFSLEWTGMAIAIGFISLLGARLLTTINQRWQRRNQHVPSSVLRIYLVVAAFIAALPVLALATIWREAQGTFGYFAATILAVELAYGMVCPCYDSLVNHYIPPQHANERATVMSVGSCFKGILIFCLSVPAGGHSGDTTMNGWVLPAALVTIAGSAVWAVLRRREREFARAHATVPSHAVATGRKGDGVCA